MRSSDWSSDVCSSDLLLTAGQVDLGFAADEIDLAGVEAQVFAAPEAVCLVPGDHPLAARKTLAPEALADARFVPLASEDAARGRIERLFEQASVRRRLVVETKYSVTYCHLVPNGVGVLL